MPYDDVSVQAPSDIRWSCFALSFGVRVYIEYMLVVILLKIFLCLQQFSVPKHS